MNTHTGVGLVVAALLMYLAAQAEGTERPILGVLAQELSDVVRSKTSYVPADYVKAVEAAGARAAPIFIDQPKEYYRRMMTSLNGVVFPGGGTDFTAPHGYAAAGRIIMDIARELNDSGVSFPILGVCQGFQLLLYLASNSTLESHILVSCNATNVALPLNFKPNFDKSTLFGDAPQEIIEILRTLPVTSNHHRFCVTENTFKSYELEKSWRVMSTNRDINGLEFISSIEHKRMPFVGLQFHPEVNAFKWNSAQANPHSRKSILSARLFYDWLVSAARANNQSFPSVVEENNSLFSNYCPQLMNKNTSSVYQAYIF